jgi:hypothetical protein
LHPRELNLITSLNARGTEPQLPTIWRHDLLTCPPWMFSDDDNAVFINSKSGDFFHGKFTPHTPLC